MPSDTARLFDAHASTYDHVNTVISLGLDALWRDWAARQAVTHRGARVFDAFAGTGRTGLRAAKLGAEVVLADGSMGMLAEARRLADRAWACRVGFLLADLTQPLPHIEGAPFDAVTVVFGLRYLEDPAAVLRQLAGLLAPGGRIVVVEFVEAGDSLVSRLASLYFFRLLPRVAGRLAGRRDLYDILAETTHRMGRFEHLQQLVESAGLRIVTTKRMGFGLVGGIVAH
jgi:demethylmenaquinone methyltransferase/2-methoxy-6-polyprenyl-1,4-benzoquinol methylase